jgi:hypothetical protein
MGFTALSVESAMTEGAPERLFVAHVADKIAHARIARLGKALAHVELLELVAAEDDQLLRLVTPQHGFDEFIAERACAASKQNDFVIDDFHAVALLQRQCHAAAEIIAHRRRHASDADSRDNSNPQAREAAGSAKLPGRGRPGSRSISESRC